MGVAAADSSEDMDTPLLLSQSHSLKSEDRDIPLLLTESHPLKRTGTVWTAAAHIITGVIGSGVLSLPWSIAQLGWLVGPFSILLIASSTLFSAFLLCNTYRSPHPEHGPHRSASYLDVVNFNLGIGNGRLCGLLVNICLYGFGIAFVITTSISLRCVHDFSYRFLSCNVISFPLLFFPSIHLWIMDATYVAKQDLFTYTSFGNMTLSKESHNRTIPILLMLMSIAICICGCREIQNSICYHNKGCESETTNESVDAYYMLLFGVIQIVLSQIPNLHNINWLSALAAIMSFAYCFIGLGLSILQIKENGHAKGSIEGVSTTSGTQKLWLVSQALGDVSFSYPFSTIIMEIQDTLKTPPPENQTMKKASVISVAVTTFFYLSCGCAGYAAFGSDTPGNLLTGFGSSEFYWLLNFANVCIVVHLVGSYQVYSQPLFATVENWFRFTFPDSEFVNHTYTLKIPLLPAFELSFLSLSFRTAYVASTTVIAMIFPYFNQILGVLGSISFWPLTIYFPVEIYLSRSNTDAWTTKWVMLQTFNIVGFVFGLFTLIGCIRGILTEKLG